MKKMMALLLSGLLACTVLPLSAQANRPLQPQRPSPNVFQNPNMIPWCESYTDSVKRSQDSGKPIFLLFTGTSWCPACMKLEREVLTKPEFARAIGNKFEFYKSEFNDPSEESIASSPDKFLMNRYRVTQFPTMVVINNQGQHLFSIDYHTGGPQAYIQEINQKLGQYQQPQAFR